MVKSCCLVLLISACALSDNDLLDQKTVIATVNGTPIYALALKTQLRLLFGEQDEDGPFGEPQRLHREALLQQLIEDRLVLLEAERANIYVSLEEIDAAFEQIHAGWDKDAIEKEMQVASLTPAELKQQLRDLLRIRKYFREEVFARIVGSDAEITEYLKAYPERLERLERVEQVRARHLVVKTLDKAKEVMQRLKSGMPFEEAAIKYSMSPDGAHGGDLGYFAKSVMPKVFDEVCFALKPSERSEIVPTDYGFHIFLLLDKRLASSRPEQVVRQEV